LPKHTPGKNLRSLAGLRFKRACAPGIGGTT
jgi:hypothetical protein